VAIATGFAISLSGPVNAALPDNPPNDKIVIDVVTANGSGCKPETTKVVPAPDNTAFTVTYNDYIVETGPSTPSLVRKNCQITLDVHVPQGFTYAVAKADYRGFASVIKGATATQKATYYFQGATEQVYSNHTWKGEFEDNWITTDEVDVAAYIYAPCGVKRYFNINTELRMQKGTSKPGTSSLIAMDSTDGSINTLYHFHWKKCPKN